MIFTTTRPVPYILKQPASSSKCGNISARMTIDNKRTTISMKVAAVTPSRRILMCVSGMSPAVITETLYALVTQDAPFIPDEIHVVTTLTGKTKILDALLNPATGHFHRLVGEFLAGKSIRFDASTVHVISQTRQVKAAANPWGSLVPQGEPQTEEVEFEDITTDADNKAAADTIYRVMRELKVVPNTVLHASVAGGRKSMSFYMGHAFSLLSDTEDKLSHVLINEPFEAPQLNFYYPPRTPVVLGWTDKAGERRTISTDQAEVKLAELSVLKLGKLMGTEWPTKAQTSFDFAVRLAQATLVPPELRVTLEDGVGSLEVCGERIDLPPQQFAVFALYAISRHHEADLPAGTVLVPEDLPANFWVSLGEELQGGRFSSESRNFSPVRSKIQKALLKAVGPAAQHFRIEADSEMGKAKGRSRAVFLNVAPQRIKLVGLNDWWKKLKMELNKPSSVKP